MQMEPGCVSSAGGEAPEAGCSPPPGDAMGTLAAKERSSQACWQQWGCGRVMEPGSHAPCKDGSAPPGGQVGGDAAATGLAQALLSSRVERGWMLLDGSSAAPLPQALDGVVLHPPSFQPSITSQRPPSLATPSSFSWFFFQTGADVPTPVTPASPLPQGLQPATPGCWRRGALALGEIRSSGETSGSGFGGFSPVPALALTAS